MRSSSTPCLLTKRSWRQAFRRAPPIRLCGDVGTNAHDHRQNEQPPTAYHVREVPPLFELGRSSVNRHDPCAHHRMRLLSDVARRCLNVRWVMLRDHTRTKPQPPQRLDKPIENRLRRTRRRETRTEPATRSPHRHQPEPHPPHRPAGTRGTSVRASRWPGRPSRGGGIAARERQSLMGITGDDM